MAAARRLGRLQRLVQPDIDALPVLPGRPLPRDNNAPRPLPPVAIRSRPLATAAMPPSELQRGQLASPLHRFAPIRGWSKYPYEFCDKPRAQAIASAFFGQGQFWARDWDL